MTMKRKKKTTTTGWATIKPGQYSRVPIVAPGENSHLHAEMGRTARRCSKQAMMKNPITNKGGSGKRAVKGREEHYLRRPLMMGVVEVGRLYSNHVVLNGAARLF